MASVHGTHAHAHTPLVPKPIPNGPRTQPRAPTAAPVPIAKTTTLELQSCTQCRRPFVARQYKTCDNCRRKSRDKRQIKKQREQDRLRVLLAQARARIADGAEVNFWSEAGGSDTDVEMEDSADEHQHAESKKRKAPLDDRPEYQTEQALLDALHVEMRAATTKTSPTSPPSCANFEGSFAIIMDPDVPAEKRVMKVVAELKTIPQVKLGVRILRESEPACGGHARTYRCCCIEPPPTPPKPTAVNGIAAPQFPPSSQAQVSSSGATLKRTQSTLQPYLKPKPRPAVKISGCDGTITVYAVADSSHPLARKGMKGQRVTVQVEHPGKDVSRDFHW
ncbi:hypothetical protein C8Q80DRAFT_1274072 [Daedaleopsis nitida]|nr:hypothetical protein C8Q80DRAFT_1274072 [Daedaleopsis nitida]